ncbi:nuclear transport factor 2 family protein [Paenarthrobacter nitroguajacolicus]|uniref:nuclear transport factor 2 family protein n=1 Tax=Paenarthrobacter nitroguajacolicus TaxID=211146 RepID=UPI003D1F1CFE
MKEASSHIGNKADCIAEMGQLHVLVAKQALNENMIRYCRGMDRKDLDLTKSTYWPESTEDHGMYVGLSHEFCDWAYSLRQGSSHKASHYVTNILIDLNGNQAKRETAFIYRTVPTDGGPTDLLFGRYRDLCERRQGEWKVLARTCVWDGAQRLAAEADPAELFGIPPTSNFGNRYPHDPIYAPDWGTAPPVKTMNAKEHPYD